MSGGRDSIVMRIVKRNGPIPVIPRKQAQEVVERLFPNHRPVNWLEDAIIPEDVPAITEEELGLASQRQNGGRHQARTEYQ